MDSFRKQKETICTQNSAQHETHSHSCAGLVKLLLQLNHSICAAQTFLSNIFSVLCAVLPDSGQSNTGGHWQLILLVQRIPQTGGTMYSPVPRECTRCSFTRYSDSGRAGRCYTTQDALTGMQADVSQLTGSTRTPFTFREL